MLPCSDFLRFLALLLVRAITRERKTVSAFLSGKSLNSLQQQRQQCCQHRERPRLKFAPTKVIFHICLILKRQRNVLCIKILSNLARRPFQCWNCYHSWARTEQTVHRSCSCELSLSSWKGLLSSCCSRADSNNNRECRVLFSCSKQFNQ